VVFKVGWCVDGVVVGGAVPTHADAATATYVARNGAVTEADMRIKREAVGQLAVGLLSPRGDVMSSVLGIALGSTASGPAT
jgi:hypothetical protein